MKTKLGVLILLLAATWAGAQTNDLTALLQQGLFEEQANRNLDAAIADYQTLALQFDRNRQLAATAIFRLGECYRMQGKTNEAAAEYERILRDFSDQTTLATLSQQDLTGMGASPAPMYSADQLQERLLLARQIDLARQDLEAMRQKYQARLVVKSEVNAAESALLRLQQQLAALDSNSAASSNPPVTAGSADAKFWWDNLKDLPPDKLEAVLPAVAPDAELTQLLQQRDDAETKLAQLHVIYSTNMPDYQQQAAALNTINQQIAGKMNGIMQALKMRAELSQSSAATNAPVAAAEEDQEIARIQQMIQNSPDLINTPDEHKHTPLENAALNGWLRVAAFLLDHGADVNARGGTALFDATGAGNRAMVEFLLAHGADVNAVNNSYNRTPLDLAAQHGFEAVTEVLLANKADVNARDSHGNTPLHTAAQFGQTRIVQLLVAAGAQVNVENSEGRTPLSYAAIDAGPEMVKMLLAAKADPNGGKGDVPLLRAISRQDAISTELLLQAGANPNSTGKVDLARLPGGVGVGLTGYGVGNGNSPQTVTPLWLAIWENQLPMVQLLLKFKANPDDSQTYGQALLFEALSDTNILEALVDAGAKVDVMGISPSSVGNTAVYWTPLAGYCKTG